MNENSESLLWLHDVVLYGSLAIPIIQAYDYYVSKASTDKEKVSTIEGDGVFTRSIDWNYLQSVFTVQDFISAYNEII